MTANSHGALIQVSRGLHLETVLAPAEDCSCEPLVKAIDAGKRQHSGLEMVLLFSSGHTTLILNQFFFQQKIKRKTEFPLYLQIRSLLVFNICISYTKLGQPSFKGLSRLSAYPFSCHFQWLLVPF